LGWQFHVLESYVPPALSRLIYPIDKGNLDILRLAHFLSLALLCWHVLPSNLSMLKPVLRLPSRRLRQTERYGPTGGATENKTRAASSPREPTGQSTK